VPHPSNTITNVNVPAPAQIQPAPPPHYFYTGRSTTPLTYHDPPPDYETLTNSCSCTTQLTTIADDYGVGSMASGVGGHQQPDLHGIYDHNGGGICSLDHNEALTASYLYPELYNVTSSRPRRHQRPASSVSSTLSSSTITASSQTTAVQRSTPQNYLTMKKWIVVALILLLLMTLSLLIGISMQHFQLLRKFLDTKAELENNKENNNHNLYRFSSSTTTTTEDSHIFQQELENTTDKYKLRLESANFDDNKIPK